MRRDAARRHITLALMAASGFAGLGYQIVWTQQASLWLGHESVAVLAVVAAFFGGLALGAVTLGARIDASLRPALWYAGCESVIGAWGLVLAWQMRPATGWLLDVIGTQPSPAWHWSVAFCGVFFLLLPATAAMGATLPAIERVLAGARRGGASIATLYAGNTLGAVAGVLATAFWLVPQFGLRVTAEVCAVLNLSSATAALLVFNRRAGGESTPIPNVASRPEWFLFASGLLGIGYEVLVVRVLTQVAENTVYTFALLLATYLVGTAIGAAGYARWRTALRTREHLQDRLLSTLAVTCLLGLVILANAEAVKSTMLGGLGPGFAAALTAEALLAATAFLAPTIVMGALFSHLCTSAGETGTTFGRAIGINTLGAAVAPLAFGLLLIPRLGPKLALLLIAGGYLALSSRLAWPTLTQGATAIAALAIGIWGPSLTIVDVPEGGRLVSHVEGVMAAVSVVEDSAGITSLHIDNRQQEGSSTTVLADARQALLPMLLHPAPRRALFLGVGTGVTAASAANDSMLQVDAVELLPEVIAASASFVALVTDGASNPRLHLITADARRFVRTSGERYDLIVSDNFHPARSGSGALYTIEHFAAVKQRLATGGVFCQWLPLHQLDLDTLRVIVRTFLAAFPHGMALLATNSLDTPVVGLVGRADDGRFRVAEVRERLAAITLPHPPAEFGIADDLSLLGSFVAGPRALARFAGVAPFNTDDHPIVAYRAPRITYAPDSLPRDRLIALLEGLDIAADDVIRAPYDTKWASRLAAYWTARDRFIIAGRDVRPASDVRRMLAQVRAPLLGILRTSPDFRPAYDPLLRMATTLARTDPSAARVLLTELQTAQPQRPEAAQALRGLRDIAP